MTIIVIMVLYMATMLWIGSRGKEHSGTMEGFLTAGKQGTLAMVAGSYLGAHIGTGIVVGGATNGATYGWGGIWYGIGSAMSFLLFGVFMAKWAYRHKYLTVPAYLRDRYSSHTVPMSLAWALLSSGSSLATIAGQIVAGKALFSMLGINPLLGSLLSMVVILIYCSVAGMWGVMATDFWQVVVVVLGMCFCIGVLFTGDNGGMATIATLPADYHNFVPFDGETLLWMILPTSLYGFVSTASFQRTASAKTEKIAVSGAIIGAVGTAVFTFLPVIIGMWGRAAYPEVESASMLFHVILDKMPPVVAGLTIAAVVAAVMSTCDTAILGVQTNLIYDAYYNTVAPRLNLPRDDKTMRRACTVMTVIICTCAMLLAFKFNDIQKLLSSGYTIYVAGGMVPFLGGILFKRGNGIGALSGMAVSMLFVYLNNIAKVISMPNAVFSVIPGAIVFVVVSLLTKPEAPKAEEAKAE